MTLHKFPLCLRRAVGNGFDLQDLLASKALSEANHNKTEAAKLVGLPSYQALTN